MDYKYTAYDRIIHITEKLPKDKISEAIEIIQEDSFQDLLDFCVEQNCFTQAQATTLYDFTIVFDSLDDNYHDIQNNNQSKKILFYHCLIHRRFHSRFHSHNPIHFYHFPYLL